MTDFWIFFFFCKTFLKCLTDILGDILISGILWVPCCVQLLSRVQLFVAPWTVARQAPLSMEFPRQEHWSEWLFPSPGDLPHPGIELESPASSCIAGKFFTHWAPWEALLLLFNCPVMSDSLWPPWTAVCQASLGGNKIMAILRISGHPWWLRR